MGEGQEDTMSTAAVLTMHDAGLKQVEIAKQLGISRQRVKQIVCPQRHNARLLLAQAISKGLLKRPATCSRCGSLARVHGHHEDYSLPLDVVWLCPTCHGRRHRTLPERLPVPMRVPLGTTPHSSFRFSPDVKRMLETLARREGTTKTAVLARLVREAAGKTRAR